MSILRYTVILIIPLLFHVGCRKERLAAEEPSWLRILNTGDSYFGSNVAVDNDGNLYVACIGNENPAAINSYGDMPSLLFKVDSQGNELWRVELPESVYLLWGCVALQNGNIVVYGFASSVNSEQVGIVLVDGGGNILAEQSFFNQSNNGGSAVFGTLHAIESSNGAIMLLMPQICCGIFALMPRIVSFDQNLNVISDVAYHNEDIFPAAVLLKMTMHEDSQHNLLIGGETGQNGGDTSQHFAFQLKLSGAPLTEDYIRFYHSYSRVVVPSRSALSPDQNALVWASAGADDNDLLFSSLFNLRGQEIYTRGPVITFWKTHQNSVYDIKKTFSGFPKNAVITKVKKCSAGGYIAVGTCNINTNQSIPSDYQILLIRLSENLDVQWVRFPNTNSQSIGIDVIEYQNGFLVLGTHHYLNQTDYPLLLKTDEMGYIN